MLSANDITFDLSIPHAEEYHKNNFNLGDLNEYVRTILFILTVYLFAGESFIFIMNLKKLHSEDLAPRFMLSSLGNLLLHLFLIITIFGSDDETIIQPDFWSK